MSFIKRDQCSRGINFNCNVSNEERVNRFVDFYMKETNEAIKLKYRKKNKHRSIFNVKVTCRCHQDTRYEGIREVDAALHKNAFKRFRNTNCSFQTILKFWRITWIPFLVISLGKPIDTHWFKISWLTCLVFNCGYCFFLKRWNYIKIFVQHE